MLAINLCLGNQKPKALVAVEKEIWKVVFAIADGCLNPTELLKKLADHLPWGKIAHLTADEIGFFGISKPTIPSHLTAFTGFFRNKAVGFKVGRYAGSGIQAN